MEAEVGVASTSGVETSEEGVGVAEGEESG